MPGPTKIYPTLYIGDLNDGSDTDKLFDLGITHVLSVGSEVSEKDEDISYLSLNVLDMEDQNILKHFETAFKYIEKARNGGACLVHCNAGVSRSATICIAYIMKKFKLTLQDATETVSEVRPSICPNPGFIRQLEQYYLNLHPELKKAMPEPVAGVSSVSTVAAVSSAPVARTSSSGDQTTTDIDSLPVENTPHDYSMALKEETKQYETKQSETAATEQRMVEVTQDKVVYSCSMCRRPLFTMDDLMPHQISQHDIAYHKRDKGNAVSADRVVCSSHYLQEPLQWMGNVDENEGKITCPKCTARVGFWKWDGQQCSCGTWVTPAIQVAKNRVDERIMPITSLVPASDQPS
jgi:dual specificity phosphatase 12